MLPGIIGGVLRSRSNWFLAASALLIVTAGFLFAFWWDRSGPLSLSGTDTTVLQIAAAPLLVFLGWAARQVRPGRSTPEQMVRARGALANRGLDWWHGATEPAWPGQIPRAGLAPLDVTWGRPAVGQEDANGPVYTSTDNVVALAERLRSTAPYRLVIRGAAGSGKSVHARQLMTELLRNPQSGEAVPVFLPLWSWDPNQERLLDWIKRYLRQAYPELAEASYGPSAVDDLVDQGLVLPILDGLDSLPMRWRETILSDSQFLSQDRLVLTCRTTEMFDAIDSYVVIEPLAVRHEDAIAFLRRVTAVVPGAWDKVDAHTCHSLRCCLSEALSQPRIIYLASMVYGSNTNTSARHNADSENDPVELTDHTLYPSLEAIEALLLRKLIPALMPEEGDWTRNFPSYGHYAVDWMKNLARLDLRDPADKKGPITLDDTDVNRIAWWNLHRGVPWLDRRQAPLRGLAYGFATSIIIAFIFWKVGRYTYFLPLSLIKGVSYGIVIFITGSLLGGSDDPRPRPRRTRWSRFRSMSWWVKDRWARHGRVILTGILIFFCFGLLGSYNAQQGLYGLFIGFNGSFLTALIIVLTYTVAHVPAPPRARRTVSSGSANDPNLHGFTRTIIFGILFGLAWGLSDFFRRLLSLHEQSLPLSLAVTSGIITGIDFVLGAWLFRFAQIRLGSRRAPNPLSSTRADIVTALICPLILGITFGLAFGASALFTPHDYAHETIAASIRSETAPIAVWFAIGTVLGSMGSEWPLYMTATTWLAIRRKLPLRLMRFLECCRSRGVVRAAGEEYQIHDNGLLQYLRSDKTPNSAISAPIPTQTPQPTASDP
jgi:hypothetical protein